MNTFMLMGIIDNIFKINEEYSKITIQVYEEIYGYSEFGDGEYDLIPVIITNRRLYGRKFNKGDRIVMIGRISYEDNKIILNGMKLDYMLKGR